MMLYAITEDEYFQQIANGMKSHEFRQIEGIILENKQTHEIKQFPVKNITLLDPFRTEQVKRNYPKVPWNDKPVFAIELGAEIVIEKVQIQRIDAGHIVEEGKPWYAVTE